MTNPFAVLDEDSSSEHHEPVQQQQQPVRQNPVAQSVTSKSSSAKPGRQQQQRKPLPVAQKETGPDANEIHDSAKHRTGGKHHERPKRGRRGGWHGHGRQFDRHSGHHRDSDKKVQQGWGAGEEASAENVSSAAVVAGSELPEGEIVATNVKEEEEVEPPVKTLDEYLAEKAANGLNLKSTKKAALRKANEGTDLSKWSHAVPLERRLPEEQQSYFPKQSPSAQSAVEKKPSEGTSNSGAVAKKQTAAVNIDIRFNQPALSSRGGSRTSSSSSGRGGSRGSGRNSTNKSRTSAPNLKDSSAFPILA